MAWQRAPPQRQPEQYEATNATAAAGPLTQSFATTTSTSTVVIDDGGVPRLRTYGIQAAALGSSSAATVGLWSPDATVARGPCTTVVPRECGNKAIGYLDSGRVDPPSFDCLALYTAYDPDLVAVVDVDPTVSSVCGNQNIRATCVPAEQRHCRTTDVTWEYDYISYFTVDNPADRYNVSFSPPYVAATISRKPARLCVTHKDPHVLELPDQLGWLMLLSRQRFVERDSAAANCQGCSAPLPTDTQAGNCLGDIVAWWSDNPAFDDASGTVRGPFFMVDSLHALPGLELRFWLGVPGGVVVDTEAGPTLLLYYQIEPPFPEGALAHHLAYLDEPGSQPGNGLSLGDWERALYWYNNTGNPNTTWSPGLAVKRIPIGDLFGFLSYGSTDEATWSPADVAPGELLGQVRIWACDVRIGTEPIVTPFSRYYEVSGTSPKPADPCPILSALGLNLFFSAIQHEGAVGVVSAANGYGIWRGVAVTDYDSGAPELVWETYRDASSSSSIHYRPIFGVDFVVCVADDKRGIPRDMVVASTSTTSLYLDPDVVLDPVDGSWRVYAGGGADSKLELFVGDHWDGSTPWQDAWCRPAEFREGYPDTETEGDGSWAAAGASPAGPLPRQAGRRPDPEMDAVYARLPWLQVPDGAEAGSGDVSERTATACCGGCSD